MSEDPTQDGGAAPENEAAKESEPAPETEVAPATNESEPQRATSYLSSEHVEEFLRVGMSVTFDRDLTNPRSTRFDTTVVGWKRGAYIIIEAPSNRDRAMAFSQASAAIRFLNDGRPSAMVVRVIESVIDRTAAFFRVSWPTEVRYAVLRQETRVATSIMCTVGADEEDNEVPGDIRNISLGGCRLVANLPLKRGAHVRCNFQLPNGDAIEGAEYEVCNVRRTSDGIDAGCRAVDLSEHNARALSFYLTMVEESDRAGAAEGPQRKALFLTADVALSDSFDAVLSDMEYSVKRAEELVHCLGYLGVSRPDILLLDPNGNALQPKEIIKLIRMSSGGAELPVYFIGENLEQAVSNVKSTGANGLIRSPEELLAALESIASPAETET